MTHPASILLAAACVLIGKICIQSFLTTSPELDRLLDNFHWTLCYGAGAWASLYGVRQATGEERAVKQWFCLGLVFLFLGQLIWNVQALYGYFPFPGPSDLFFTWLGSFCMVGFWQVLRRTLTRCERWALRIDTASIGVIIFSLSFALYLPYRGEVSWLSTAAFFFYPVSFLTAAGMGVLAMLAKRLVCTAGYLLFMAGLLGIGIAWMVWNWWLLREIPFDGTWVGWLLSASALLMGAGVLYWRTEVSTNASYISWCVALQRLLPLLLTGTACVCLWLWSNDPEPVVRQVITTCALLMIALAVLRQSLLLVESQQLIRAERRLREGAKAIERLFDQSPECFAILEPRGEHSPLCRSYNPAFERKLVANLRRGFTQRPLDQVLETGGWDLLYHLIKTCLRTKRPVSGEEQLPVPQGGTCWFSITLVPHLDEEDRVDQMVLVLRDIQAERLRVEETEALNAELERRVKQRTRELELANEELASFSYMVSHDLRTPLRSIKGYSQLLLEDHAPSLDHDAKEMLTSVCKATDRMAEIIDDLLRLARVSQQPIAPDPLDLAELAREVLAQCQSRDPERKVEIEIAPQLPARGDRQLLRHVLENLLGNAWKFTRKQPHPRISLTEERVNNTPCFVVRDNGAGFNMEFAPRLFQPFQRLHDAQQFEGTGLGLAIVKRIIERHGGRIWVESEVGIGTSFFFTLETPEFSPTEHPHE